MATRKTIIGGGGGGGGGAAIKYFVKAVGTSNNGGTPNTLADFISYNEGYTPVDGDLVLWEGKGVFTIHEGTNWESQPVVNNDLTLLVTSFDRGPRLYAWSVEDYGGGSFGYDSRMVQTDVADGLAIGMANAVYRSRVGDVFNVIQTDGTLAAVDLADMIDWTILVNENGYGVSQVMGGVVGYYGLYKNKVISVDALLDSSDTELANVYGQLWLKGATGYVQLGVPASGGSGGGAIRYVVKWYSNINDGHVTGFALHDFWGVPATTDQHGHVPAEGDLAIAGDHVYELHDGVPIEMPLSEGDLVAIDNCGQYGMTTTLWLYSGGHLNIVGKETAQKEADEAVRQHVIDLPHGGTPVPSYSNSFMFGGM